MLTIGEIHKGYLASHEFRVLSSATKKSYLYALSRWEAWAEALAEPETITKLAISTRDGMWKDRPGMARLFLSTSSAMFGWAEKRRLLAHNPVKGLTRPKSGEHTQWPDTAIDYALKNAPEHIRLACLIGLTTSQRIGDICNAKMVDIIDGVWHIKQSKTGTSLRIPLTEEVLSEIAKHKSVWMLGKKWRSEYLSSVVANFIRKAGFDGLTFHGLRKAAASKMAESGCTVEELAAITGHKSLAVVAHYIKAADQAKLARRAMEKTYG